jgi:Ca2+-binding EF-hand superfamily protein
MLLLGLAFATGCDTAPPPKPLPAPPKAVSTPAARPVAKEVVVAASVAPQPEPPATVGPAAETAPPAPTFATERIVLLAPMNPVLVEFQLSIDGRPHTQALERLVAEVLKVADADGDGRPTWKEVTESKRFKYGQFGNVAITNDNNYKQVAEMYDADRDAVVDAAELPRFLTRNAGSARAFSVRGLADYRRTGRDSPLWALFDADEDGLISAAERAAAPGRILSRDTDDDEIVLPGDVNPRVAADPVMMTARRRGAETVVRLLGAHADWDSVKGSLEGHYAGNGFVRADSFPLTPGLFAALDKNADGRLVKAEYPGLNDVPPHIVIAVSFGRAPREGEAPAEPTAPAGGTPNEDRPVPSIRLVSVVPELAGGDTSVAQQPGRITLRVGGLPLTFYLNDTVAGSDYQAQAKQALMGLDADKNGYLEEKEVPANLAGQLGQFAAVDVDENGKVYEDEIVEFLKQQQAGLRAQIHLLAADRDDALFAALDLDHDQRLDAREVESIPGRLAQLDANADGELSGDEVPISLAVGLARGNLENLDALFTPPPVIARAPAEGTPRWFTSMDANGDGAVSRREFLGPAEAFAALDTSGDGLIDAAEAKAIATETAPAAAQAVAAPAGGN